MELVLLIFRGSLDCYIELNHLRTTVKKMQHDPTHRVVLTQVNLTAAFLPVVRAERFTKPPALNNVFIHQFTNLPLLRINILSANLS
jgi:hypothetical protein